MLMSESSNSNFNHFMMNPKAFMIKKWLAPILNERFAHNQSILERLSTVLATDQDVKDFGNLVTDIYDAAYRKAVEDYRKQLEELGLKVTIGTTSQRNQDY